MDMDMYQEYSADMAKYPGAGEGEIEALLQCALGLGVSVGKVDARLQRLLCEGESGGSIREELGRVLWWVARMSDELGIPLSEIAEENLGRWINEQLGG